jgi:hypothetical protein
VIIRHLVSAVYNDTRNLEDWPSRSSKLGKLLWGYAVDGDDFFSSVGNEFKESGNSCILNVNRS